MSLSNKVNAIARSQSFLNIPLLRTYRAAGLSARVAVMQIHGSARTVNVNQISHLRQYHVRTCIQLVVARDEAGKGEAAACKPYSSSNAFAYRSFDKAGPKVQMSCVSSTELRLHFPALLQKGEKKQTIVPPSEVHVPDCGESQAKRLEWGKKARNRIRNTAGLG